MKKKARLFCKHQFFFIYFFAVRNKVFQIFFKFKSEVSYLRDFTCGKFTIVVKIISNLEFFRTLEELSGEHGFNPHSI